MLRVHHLSPQSIFTRVREVHRQLQVEGEEMEPSDLSLRCCCCPAHTCHQFNFSAFFFYFTFIKSAHFRHLTEELTLMLQHCLCGYEKLHVVFVILFVLSRVCLTLGVFVQVINGAPLVQGIFRDH